MFGMDMETARDRAYTAIDDMADALALSDNVETKYLDRLVEDRDRMIFGLYYQLGVPALEIAKRVRIPWPQVLDIVDAAIAKHKEKSAATSLSFRDTSGAE